MQYRKMGKTGIMISALGFGAMRLPHKLQDGQMVIDEEESHRLIHRAVELGVNYFDSAPYYCNSESERVMGAALKGMREKVIISTKNPIETPSGSDWRERLERSLKKLDTDYIDFYHMWGISWETYTKSIDVPGGPLAEAYKAKQEGLIKHISFSFHDDPKNLFSLIDIGVFESMLVQYNLLDRANEEAIAHAAEKGLGVVIMGPVAGGRLGAPSQDIQKMITGGVKSSAETALRFVLSNPGVTCALSGMSTIEQAEENAEIASRDIALTPEESQNIRLALDEKKKLAALYCTGCRYCMPCPQEVTIPAIFDYMNNYRLYGLKEFARKEYSEIGTSDWKKGKRADACIQCGECEEKCPQKIKIIDQLIECHKVLSGEE